MSTRDELLIRLDLEDDEFDELYSDLLSLIRQHGTLGVETMLDYVEQELTAGREHIE